MCTKCMKVGVIMQVYIDGKIASKEAQAHLSEAVALGKVYIVKITFEDGLRIETQAV